MAVTGVSNRSIREIFIKNLGEAVKPVNEFFVGFYFPDQFGFK
jgi:hypothetical protein